MILSEKDIWTSVEVLKAYEKRSTCCRVQVAAMIMKEGRPINTGWNGVASGILHCNEVFTADQINDPNFMDIHRVFSERYEKHAEMNAIAQCARHGIATIGCQIIQTVSPCTYCAKLIEGAGINEVYFTRYYDRHSQDAFDYLSKNSVKIFRIDESEKIIYQLT